MRGDASVISTGHEIVVWGGDVEAFNMGIPGPSRNFVDGAAYNVARDEWRSIPAAPIIDDAEYSYAVWAGDRMVGYRGTHGAAWDPTSNTWNALPKAPAEVLGLVWTGQEVIALGANARLDMAASRWSGIPAPPFELATSSATWTGHELLVVGRQEGLDVPADNARGMAFDPVTNSWRELPRSNINAQAIDAVWDGRRLVVVNYDMSAATYDPRTDRWHELSDVPARFYEWCPRIGAAEGHAVAFMAQSMVVLTPDDEWVPLAYGEARAGAAGAVGDRLYVFGWDYETERNRFSALRVADATDETDLQVGVASLRLPRGYEFEDASFESIHESIVQESVIVRVSRQEGTCTVRSTYGLPFDIKDSKEIAIDPVDGSAAPDARVGPRPDRIVSVTATSTDTVSIRCDDPAAAANLARYITFQDSG